MAVELLVLYTLATARLTGLLLQDEVTRPARDAILKRLNAGRAVHLQVAYLLVCTWCASVWIAAAVAPLAWYWGTHPAVAVPALALAMSQVTGMLAQLGR